MGALNVSGACICLHYTHISNCLCEDADVQLYLTETVGYWVRQFCGCIQLIYAKYSYLFTSVCNVWQDTYVDLSLVPFAGSRPSV